MCLFLSGDYGFIERPHGMLDRARSIGMKHFLQKFEMCHVKQWKLLRLWCVQAISPSPNNSLLQLREHVVDVESGDVKVVGDFVVDRQAHRISLRKWGMQVVLARLGEAQ